MFNHEADRARCLHRHLLAGSALAAIVTATPAVGQGPAGAEAAQAPAANFAETDPTEIIVTATKQASPVSRVPVSIAVVTSDTLEDLSIRNADELSRIAPSLVITNSNSSAGSSIYLRGIASNVGAPTVGVYLDDIQITRRNNSSAFNGNGTSFPQFFDLDRVEILRGPQGTLYGGSSIGGTVRFVLPEASLDDTRIRAKAEVSTTKSGDASYELGASIATPLVQDRLGMITSVYGRRLGGYIDHVSRFNGAVLDADTNSQVSYSGRVALLWAPTARVRVKPSIYLSNDTFNDSDQYWTNVGGFTQPARTTPTPTITGAPYTAPAFTYPAYNVFGPYRTGNNCNVGERFQGQVEECVLLEKRESTLIIPSLTASIDLDWATVTSVTSYTYDKVEGNRNNSFADLLLFGIGGKVFDANIRVYRNPFLFDNKRTGWTQELRLATDADRRLSFVGGLYFADFRTQSLGQWTGNLDELTRALFGRTVEQHFGGVNPFPPSYFDRRTDQTEREYAAFGEATFKLTDQLNVIAGARVSRTKFSYFEATAGSTVRRAVATAANGGLTEGSVSETPISPKFALQYFIDGRNMVYASATKGYRVGGVSSRPIGPACDAELAALGFPNLPAIPFKSDTVWSYEVGAKLRPFGNILSLEAGAYRIEWKDTQVSYRLTCQGNYVANAGSAQSQGVDLGATLTPNKWLSINGSVSYVDSTYDELSLTVGNVTTKFINQGDRAPVPKWSANLGAEVRQDLAGDKQAYARADFQYTGRYPRIFGPGTNGFFPDVYIAEPTRFASARAGVQGDRWDLSAFVTNIFNSKDDVGQATNYGRGGCLVDANGNVTTCARDTRFLTPTTFRPRTIGLTLRYKH